MTPVRLTQGALSLRGFGGLSLASGSGEWQQVGQSTAPKKRAFPARIRSIDTRHAVDHQQSDTLYHRP